MTDPAAGRTCSPAHIIVSFPDERHRRRAVLVRSGHVMITLAADLTVDYARAGHPPDAVESLYRQRIAVVGEILSDLLNLTGGDRYSINPTARFYEPVESDDHSIHLGHLTSTTMPGSYPIPQLHHDLAAGDWSVQPTAEAPDYWTWAPPAEDYLETAYRIEVAGGVITTLTRHASTALHLAQPPEGQAGALYKQFIVDGINMIQALFQQPHMPAETIQIDETRSEIAPHEPLQIRLDGFNINLAWPHLYRTTAGWPQHLVGLGVRWQTHVREPDRQLV